jgi:hypothetical protein
VHTRRTQDASPIIAANVEQTRVYVTLKKARLCRALFRPFRTKQK